MQQLFFRLYLIILWYVICLICLYIQIKDFCLYQKLKDKKFKKNFTKYSFIKNESILTHSHSSSMPMIQISKHSGYMQECGIDLQLISKTMKILTILQEINISLMQQILRGSGSSAETRSHYLNKNFNRAIGNRYLESFDIPIPSQQSVTSPQFLTEKQQITLQVQPMASSQNKNQIEEASILLQKTDMLIELIHHLYVDYHDSMIRLTYLFGRFRQIDVREKFNANVKTWQKLKQKKPYLNITKNLFLKAYFIEDYLKNTKLYLNQIGQSYPIANYYLNSPYHQLETVQSSASHLKTQIQLDYSNKSSISSSRSVRQLRNLVEITTMKPIGSPFILGFWMGTVILIIFAIILIIVFFQINFTTNTDFQRTFPIWRGLWYFIYLIWLMGINTYIFNYFKVNFNLLTTYNNFHMPNPSRLIICAAIFTSIHFLLFLMYVIKLAQIGNMIPQVPEQFLPGLSWILLILFFIFPLRKFHYRQRLYPLKMFFRALASPFIGVQWKFILFIDLFVSFRQPIRDVMYSIRYYFIDDTAPYSDTIIYETVAGMSLYCFKIIVSSRNMYQNRLFGGPPLNSIYKSILGMATIFASYMSKNDNSQFYYIYIWLVVALISSSYSYYMDLWNDWGLMDKKHGYLRQKLMYRNRKIYYGIICLNLILRFVWMLNSSPDIIRKFRIKPYIIVLIISSIQITRRAIWMIFRVQNQHLNSEIKINKLFSIQKLKLKQIQQKQAEIKKNLVIKKTLSWLKIDHLTQNTIKQINSQLQQKHRKIMQNLTKKLQEAEVIAKNYSSQQQKYLLD